MKSVVQFIRRWFSTILILCPLALPAQTLDFTNGVQTYTALTNTTVTLSGRCELHVIAANNPMPGCQINLNSPDAWFFLDHIQPATVTSGYLSQIKVNGASAVANSNVRVVEDAMGTIIIPQGPGYQPLQVYSGTQFTGASMSLGLYTYYTGANLAPLYSGIRSFKLKRGYMATFAQQPDGTGISQVYVAQDGDLDVGALPLSLSGSVGFIRVFPWRWTGKKGWAGGASGSALKVNPLWNYDWDNVATSTPNVAYVPMRHDANWNSYANINNKHDSTHALGFNEPDNTTANGGAQMTVDQAIAQWPQLEASGLRLGSPAVSDGGLSWLYNFMDEADALQYRVDYVAVHFYRCGYTAQQLHDWLLAIHNQTHRPIWLTEFNNGANWTTCAVPTLQQNAQTIQSFISMLDSAPFVERYAIYNWVGDTRAMVDTNNMLTPAGTNYLNEYSPAGYVQDFPAGVGPDANYLLDDNALDRTGSGNDAMLVGAPSFTTGVSSQAIQLDGVHDYIQMPANVGISSNFTFAAWVKWDGGTNWQRIFDIGADTSRYMFLTPRSGGNTLRFAITTNGYSAEERLDSAPLTPGVWTHVTVTLNGSIGKLFVNGTPVATNSTMTLNPAVIGAVYNYLGKSQFPTDPLFAGQLDDVVFAGYALTDAQVTALPTTTPPQFASDPIVSGDAYINEDFTGTIAGDATNSAGGTLTFSKAGGPAWLAVASDGALSGVPAVADLGTNQFTVRVVNSGGAEAVTRLTIAVKSHTPQPGNPGFEQPVTGGYIYNPIGASWTFSGSSGDGSGVTANGSGFTAGNAAAPEGTQVGFLQEYGSISQSVSGFLPGTNYTVSFMASQRQNKSGGQAGQTFNVTVDGAVIGSFEPAQSISGYIQYRTNFTATATMHTLAFVGTDLHGGDNTVFLDDVKIFATYAVPAAPVGLTATPGNRQVSLSWTASAGASGYNIKRAQNSGGPYTTITSTGGTSYTDTGLTNYTTYYYVASATNSFGESADSLPVSVKPAIILGNIGFEVPATSSYIYAPGGASWTFTGSSPNGSGVTANNSGFTAGNAPAPEGTQVAFLQGIASIVQSVTGFVPGNAYTVKFFASQRQNKNGGQVGQTFDVKLNNTVIGSFEPPQAVSSYREYQTNFIAPASANTLSFVGTDLHGGDNTVFLDDVRISAVARPQFSSFARLANGNLQFNGSGTAGIRYELDAATNLVSPVNWVFVTHAVAGTNGLFQMVDPQTASFPQRFYRITFSP